MKDFAARLWWALALFSWGAVLARYVLRALL